MKISEHWLREWASPKLDSAALAQRLTLGGLEVAALEAAGATLDGVVVGEICTIDPHPWAEHLKVCGVNAGRKAVVRVVCGAGNAARGLKAPLALPGAVLPAGVTVRRVDIRGVTSAGMLCSAAELGLVESSAGLLALDSGAPVGQPLAQYLKLDDTVMDIELTPNRGDCLSVAGIAREVAALTGTRLTVLPVRSRRVHSKRRLRIKLQAKQDCPRYVGRVIERIDSKAFTPIWMVERLRRSGVRSINPVVDITNYVMLELGQPMHAFDLDKLRGSLCVRHAGERESLKLLDGTKPRLQTGTLLIADDSGPLALAGIMGGEESAVSAQTHSVFLESAYFRPEAIAARARSLGLQTESSCRFERGVDPQLQRKAVERATALLGDVVGGKPGAIIEAKLDRYLPRRNAVGLRRQRISEFLNLSLPDAKTKNILTRLGMQVSSTSGGWRVKPPSWRFDIEREVDLIEEIARVHGYDKVPSRMPRVAARATNPSEALVPIGRFKAVLVDRDYQEVITYSFVEPGVQALLTPASEGLQLANPISADMAVMRTSLWPGLLQVLVYNRNRQQQRLRLFELGRCFVRHGRRITQDVMLGGVITGLTLPAQWASPARAVDFFDAKGDVEALLRATGQPGRFRFVPGSHPGLHPGQQAQILRDGQAVGWLGELHPDARAKLELEAPVYAFEAAVCALQQGQLPQFQEISRFPSIRRDLAVVVSDTVPAQAVLDCVAESAGQLLVDLQLFDEYRGEGIDSGRKSLALGLTFQDSSRTLKEEVIESVMGCVISALQSNLGAGLRTK